LMGYLDGTLAFTIEILGPIMPGALDFVTPVRNFYSSSSSFPVVSTSLPLAPLAADSLISYIPISGARSSVVTIMLALSELVLH